MRTVTGRTDRVVVIGAGLGGLSAALRLAGCGREVVVLEREDRPGGRCGVLEDGGYRFDTGPTVLTMPELIGDAFRCVGQSMTDWLDLERLDPVYRAFYPDGSTLDVRADVDATADSVADVCGPVEAAGYRRYVEFVSRLYRLQMHDFIDRNLDSPFSVLTTDLARLAAIGGFRKLSTKLRQFFTDPRTVRLFSFQSLYAGLAPDDALALYAVIGYMDTVAGVWFPRGGMAALPQAMAGAAAKAGVSFRYGCTVSAVEVQRGRATAALTTDGDRVPADVFVLNPDLPTAYDLLPPSATPRRVRRQRISPSCFLLLTGSTAAYRRTAHHTVHFGRAWTRTFREVVDRGQPMSDPSVFVTNPTRTDPALAPPGRHVYSALFPTPNLGAPQDWRTLTPRYRDECIEALERFGYVGFRDAVEVEHVATPLDWANRGMAAGSPFSAAHTFRQTGPLRAANLAPKVDGVVFTGSGTQPGVGVPMVLLSGRLAAERIVGPGVR